MTDKFQAAGSLPGPWYQALFEDHPHAMAAVDEQGRVQALNAAARREASLAVGDLLASDDSAWRVSVAEGRSWEGALHFDDAQGRVFSARARALPLPAGAPAQAPRLLALAAAMAPQDPDDRPGVTADIAPVMIWMAGTDALCDWFNKPWLAFTGRTLAQSAGDGWIEDVHPEDVERCVAIYRASFDERQPFSMDFRLRRHDGQYRWILDNGVPRHAADGTFEGYVGSCIDIHERKQLEERLAEHTQALRLADRRQNEFLAMLSHQLRSPLAPIANAASVLRTMEGENPTLLRLREIIDRQVGRLRRLVEDLIDVTRVMQGQITLVKGRVSVQELLRSAAEASQAKLDAGGHTLRIDVPSAPLWVSGDSVRLAQAVGNILSNAASFSTAPSVISLTARVSGDTIEVAVRDQGEGIASEFLPFVFDLFARQDMQSGRAHDGLGLGLPLARRVVQLHGGDVKAFSDGPGRGAEFVVSLPLDRDGALRTDAPAAPPASPSYRVLVIEANPDTRYLMRLQIELWGHQVATAGSVEESLKLVDGFQPQVVLCDLDGADATRLNGLAPLRQKLPHGALFAALAAYGHHELEANARAAGFDTTLAKPLRPDALAAALGRAPQLQPVG